MDNGIYVALTHQITLFRDMDATANNIANTNTTGYNAERLIFDTYLAKDMNNGMRNKLAYPNNVGTFRDTENGSMHKTGNQLDFAIQGDAYFTIETPLGVRYTRAGNFTINGGGTLTTQEGYPVLDAQGKQLIFPEETSKIEVGESGNLKVDGNDYGSIGVAQFASPQLMERISSTLYKTEAAPVINPTDIRVAQGMLEGSNVKPISELTHMMTLNHDVTNAAQYIAIVYDLQRKASTTWAQQG